MILALAFALIFAQDPGGTVRGQVRSELTGQPLSGAVVEVRAADATRSSLTGSDGGYLLRSVPTGRRLVRASYLGYDPLEIEVIVSPGSDMVLDLSLRLKPISLHGILVSGSVAAGASDTVPIPPPALGLAGMRALESSTPGIAELGLGDAFRGSPGPGPVDPSDVLYVRGAPADLKLVLLDGAPVYTPFHVAGLLESFDADVLRSAALHLGGAPARYDGGLSYIMELNTRSGRIGRPRGTGAVDLMSARSTLDGSIGERFRFVAGGRLVHGLGVSPWVGGGFPYSYEEGLVRLDAGVGRDGEVSLTAFRNEEGVSVDGIGQSDRDAGWGNSAVSLRYRGRFDTNQVELTAAYGGFEASLPITQGRDFPTWGRTERVRVTADVTHDGSDLTLRYGGSFDHLSLSHRVRSGAVPGQEWSSATTGESGGAYAEAAWQASPRVRLRGGGRADLFFEDASLRIAPRISATWMLSDRAALTAAAGRYHQYVRTVSARTLFLQDGTADSVFLASGLAVGEATHFNLSLHQELDDGLRLGVEGFFKTFEGQAAALEPGQSSGVDLWVRKDAGRYRGWLGYSLSWVWSVDSPSGVSDTFAGRQLLSAGLGGPIGRLADLEARVAYGAGLPFTAIPMNVTAPSFGNMEFRRSSSQPQLGQLQGAGDTPLLPGAPSDPYLRIDLGVSRSFRTNINGTRLDIVPYAKVLNSLNRRDGLFYWYDGQSGNDPRAVAALPVVPIVGMRWTF